MATQIATTEERKPSALVAAIQNKQLDGGPPRSMFMPASMGEAMEVAKLMAHGNFVPAHLRGKPGDCLAVVMQASRWGMDPFAVGNKTYFVNDRMAYEAQLVNAVINSSGVLDGRLHPEWEGEGNELVCTVTGKLKGDPVPKTRRVPIKTITTRNSPLWKQDPEQQLAYYASRAWVRLHAPEVLLGVYTPDELSESRGTGGAGQLASDGPQPITMSMLEHQANDGTLSADNPSGAEGRDDNDRGEAFTDDAPHPFATLAASLKARANRAETIIDLGKIEAELSTHRDAAPAHLVEAVDQAINERRGALTGGK